MHPWPSYDGRTRNVVIIIIMIMHMHDACLIAWLCIVYFCPLSNCLLWREINVGLPEKCNTSYFLLIITQD